MSKNHAQAGDYAGAMEASGVPKVCGYRHRIRDWGPCRGPLERDHQDELRFAPWQDPKKAWLVYICEHHHDCKTTEAGAKHRAKKEGRMADTAPRLPTKATGSKKGTAKAPPKRGGGWKRWLANTVAVATLVVIGLSYWFNITDPILAAVLSWLPLVALVVACAAFFMALRYVPRAYRRLRRKRDQERADWLLAKADGIARQMQCARDSVVIEPRGRRAWTRDGVCVRGRVTYPDHVLDNDPKLRKAVERHWRHKLGMNEDELAIEWDVRHNLFLFWPTPELAALRAQPDAPETQDAPQDPTDAREKADEKLSHVMESVRKRAKGDWSHTLVRHDAIGPLEAEIVWPPDFDAAADEQRVKLMETINLGLPGRWRADSWDGESRKLHVTRRPKLDRFIANPGHSERVAWHLIPLGRDESGSVVIYDALSIPHVLVVGATRRGKSVCLRTIIFAVLNPPEGTPLIDVPAVVLIDPKEVEFGGYEGMPGVVEVATEDKQMANAVFRVLLEQKRRYRWKKRQGVPLSRHRPIYLIIDEYQEFCEALNDVWIAKKGTTGKEHPAVRATRRIARLGAAARIHLILATQRPDLDWFKGVLRENIQFRLAFGKLSPQASEMAFSRRDIGRDIPDSLDGQLLRGRGNCSVGDDGRPREFQAYWTPNPDPDEKPNALDRSMLDMLIPKQRDGLEEPMWDLDRLLAEFADDEDDDDDDDDAGAGTSSSRYRGNGSGTTTKSKPRPQQAPKPRRTAHQARPEGVRALRLARQCGTPRWVMLDGERLCAVEIEPDESAADHWLVTFQDEDKHLRDPVSFPESAAFDLAED